MTNKYNKKVRKERKTKEDNAISLVPKDPEKPPFISEMIFVLTITPYIKLDFMF